MKTTDIQNQVKLTLYHIGFCYIANVKINLNPCLARFCLRFMDRFADKVYPGYLPSVPGEGDGISPRAATQVQGAPRRKGTDDLNQFGRGDAGVPGRFSKVGDDVK